MGFWDKVKSVGNMITGGAAEVMVTVDNDAEIGEPFNITIKAGVKDQDVKIDKVYLKIKSFEEVKAEGVEIEVEDGETEIEKEMVHKIVETYATEIAVDGPQTLEGGQTYEWTVEVVIPDNNYGTYKGPHARHEWQLFAGLDAFGNDPDSGWLTFEIY